MEGMPWPIPNLVPRDALNLGQPATYETPYRADPGVDRMSIFLKETAAHHLAQPHALCKSKNLVYQAEFEARLAHLQLLKTMLQLLVKVVGSGRTPSVPPDTPIRDYTGLYGHIRSWSERRF